MKKREYTQDFINSEIYKLREEINEYTEKENLTIKTLSITYNPKIEKYVALVLFEEE